MITFEWLSRGIHFRETYNKNGRRNCSRYPKGFLKENLPLYKVVDVLNHEVTGSWYEWELMKAIEDQEFWKVESILKTRKRNGKDLIIWQGYGDKFSSWVLASDIKDDAK